MKRRFDYHALVLDSPLANANRFSSLLQAATEDGSRVVASYSVGHGLTSVVVMFERPVEEESDVPEEETDRTAAKGRRARQPA